MTAEERVLIELSDVQSLEFTCKRCGVRLGISPGKEGHHLPARCAGCGTEFFALEGSLHGALRSFLRLLNGDALQDAPFRFQLVVDSKVKQPKAKADLADV